MQNHVSEFYLMATYAIKAPSGHNTQPWKIRIEENVFEVYPDFNFALPVTDMSNRELYISLGCAVENLCLAANEKGYGEYIKINKNSDNHVFVRIELTKGTANPSLLFPQIDKRQTNRSVYLNREIPQKDIFKLSNMQLESDIKHFIYKYDDEKFGILKDFVFKANEFQLSDPQYKEELLKWICYTKKQVDLYKCGLSYQSIGASKIPPFLRKIAITAQLKASKQNKADGKRIVSSSHMVLFSCKNNTPEEWIKLGRSLERFLLQASRMKIACGFMNQPCQIEALAESIRKKLEIEGTYPAILLRMGYARSVAFAPRKQADSLITMI